MLLVVPQDGLDVSPDGVVWNCCSVSFNDGWCWWLAVKLVGQLL